MGIALAVAVPALACYGALRWRTDGAHPVSRLFAAALALGLGTGLAAWTYFVALRVAGNHTWAVRIDAAFWLMAFAIVLRSTWPWRIRVPKPPLARPWIHAHVPALIAAVGFLAMATLALASLWWSWQAFPHGQWDAWAIWNLRARAIWRGVPDWASILSPALGWSHPEYPLLVPLSVTRLWAYGGHESMAAPVLVAGVFFLASTATVVAFVGKLRGWPTGWLSGLALLAPVVFTDKVAAQIADVPFAFFVLAAVSLLAIDRRAGAPGPPTLLAAGAAVGLAAWTKDEGLVPLVLLPLLCTVFPGTSSRRRMVGGLLAGAAPILLAVAGFKLLMAPPGYLFAQQSVATIAGRLGSVDRLQFVVEQILARTLWWGGGAIPVVPALAAALVVMGRLDRAGARRSGFVLLVTLGMLSGYALAYLITPVNVGWQIATSFDRLFLQLWPTLVCGGFQLAGRETPSRNGSKDRAPGSSVVLSCEL